MSLSKVQNRAVAAALVFTDKATKTGSAEEAADWSLAAKNAAATALQVEQMIKTREAAAGRGR